MAGRAGCEVVLDTMLREGRTSTIRDTAQRSVENQRKRVWQLRTLLPGLPRESVVASFRLPVPSGTHSTIHLLKLCVSGAWDCDVSVMAYSVYTCSRVRTSSIKPCGGGHDTIESWCCCGRGLQSSRGWGFKCRICQRRWACAGNHQAREGGNCARERGH